jgi:hypothetical protein
MKKDSADKDFVQSYNTDAVAFDDAHPCRKYKKMWWKILQGACTPVTLSLHHAVRSNVHASLYFVLDFLLQSSPVGRRFFSSLTYR